MNNRRLIAAGVVLVAGATACGYFVGRARAAGAPTMQPLTYSGTVTDANGTPLTGSKLVEVVLWDMGTDGSQKCAAGPTSVPLTAGSFQLPLPSACADAVHASPDLWVEVFVDSQSTGRTKIGAVPYALESQTASQPAGALATTLTTLTSRLNALEPRVTAVESKAVLTKVDFATTSPTEDFAAGCRSTLNAQQCGVLASRHCMAAGYPYGWFVGESADGNSTFYVACVK